MMKVAELIGAPLDYWVAKALYPERKVVLMLHMLANPDPVRNMACYLDDEKEPFRPSIDWAHGGPLIETKRVSVVGDLEGGWNAYVCKWLSPYTLDEEAPDGSGPTALVAAMRAIVADAFGPEVKSA